MQINFWPILNYSLLNGFLFVSSVFFAFKYFESSRTSVLRLLSHACFLFITSIISIQTAAGVFGGLNTTFVSVLAYGLCLFVFADCGPFFISHCKGFKLNFSLCGILPFIVLIAFLIVELFNGYIYPVWEFDSISYHMPMVYEWLKSGSLWKTAYTVFAGPLGYYPGNGELLAMWNVLPFHADYFADFPNFFLIAVFAITAYDFARHFFSQTGAALFTALFVYCPLVLKQINTAGVDLLFSLSLLYTAYFLYKFAATKKFNYAVLTFLAFGLSAGSKYLAVPYLLIPAVIFTAFALWHFRGRYIHCAVIGLVCFIFAGGFWYLRNWIIADNPIFPAALNLDGREIFKGYGNMTQRILGWSIWQNIPNIRWSEAVELIRKFASSAGYQIFMVFFVIAVSFIYIADSFANSIFKLAHRKPSVFLRFVIELFLFTFLIFLTLFFIFVYFIAPYSYQNFGANIRYALPVILIASFITALCYERFKKMQTVILSLAAALIAFTLIKTFLTPDLPHQMFGFALIKSNLRLFGFLLAKIAAMIIVGAVLFSNRGFQKFGIILLSLLIPFVITSGNNSVFSLRENQKYAILETKYPWLKNVFSAAKWTSEHVKKNENIAYTGFFFNYAFLDSGLFRNIKYINLNGCDRCSYFNYRDKPDSIANGADYGAWKNSMRRSNIKYLVLFDLIKELKREPSWIHGHPYDFQLMFSRDGVYIYRII